MSAVKSPTSRSLRTSRGESTMASFLDAAVGCLVERGFAGTTTAEISRRAGASPGLFVRYWPSKAALLAAAAVRAHRRGTARIERRLDDVFSGATDARTGVRAAVAAIVELYSEPEMRCLAELSHAATTDLELASELATVTRPIDDEVLEAARRIAPSESVGRDFDDNVRLVLDCARGVAQRTATMPARDADAARTATTRTLVRLLGLADS